MSLETFARKIPKAELHLHLEGAVAAATVADLAKQNGVALPPFDSPAELYQFHDLPTFLVVYNLVCESIRTAADFQRTTFEMLERCAESGARYVEFFFSPHAHLEHGVPYPTMLEGIVAGMRQAEKQYGVKSNVIPAHSRELGPEQGNVFLDMVLAHRIPEVIGIGLDYNEAPFPAAPFAKMYARAEAAGLKRTTHAGENGPASNIRDGIELLHVNRIDHGYHIVDDPTLMAECRELGIPFTCCPTATSYTPGWDDLTALDHPIRQMMDQGLTVTLHSDDPTMILSTLAGEYLVVAEKFGLSRDQVKKLALASLAATWLDDATKQAWAEEWSTEIDRLIESELP